MDRPLFPIRSRLTSGFFNGPNKLGHTGQKIMLTIIKNNLLSKLIYIVVLSTSVSCHLLAKDNQVIPGAVLKPGESIEATNKFGLVKISYASPVKRKFEWDGTSRIVKLTVRPEPFEGREGMYDPADVWFVTFRTRLVIEEYTKNFNSYDYIYKYLYEGSGVYDWVYTSDGLVVGYGTCPSREEVSIDVFQLLLNGKKPTNLRGARNNQIKLIKAPIKESKSWFNFQ